MLPSTRQCGKKHHKIAHDDPIRKLECFVPLWFDHLHEQQFYNWEYRSRFLFGCGIINENSKEESGEDNNGGQNDQGNGGGVSGNVAS